MLTLTPNRRLAVFLHRQIKQDWIKKSVQRVSQVLPFQYWLETLYQQISVSKPLPSLLTHYEEELIWTKVFKKSELGSSLLRSASLARLTLQANEWIHHWQIALNSAFAAEEDSEAFLKWHKEYNNILVKNHWVDRAGLLSLILSLLPQYSNLLPKHIKCVGFNEWTPLQTKFLEALVEEGVSLSYESLNCHPEAIQRIELPSAESEIRAAAQTAAHWLKTDDTDGVNNIDGQNISSPDALSHIGIVILDLEKRREEVEGIFSEILPPGSFNIAAPIPLIQYPCIKALLQALSLVSYDISLENISRFLRSPFFQGGITEQMARAALDVKLHALKQTSFSLKTLLFICEEMSKEKEHLDLSILINILQALIKIKPNFKGKKTTDEWVTEIDTVLSILGWKESTAGEEGSALNLYETAVKQEWPNLLSTYQALNKLVGAHRFSKALHHLQALAQKTTFLPPPSSETPPRVQVLGLLEAVGLPFEHLWVMGLHHEAWPPAPNPNPFIPLKLQIALNLPRSHSQREWNVARHFTQQLSQGARKNVIFSHPAAMEEFTLKESPLIRGQVFNVNNRLELGGQVSTLDKELGCQIRALGNSILQHQNLPEYSTAYSQNQNPTLTSHSHSSTHLSTTSTNIPWRTPKKGSVKALTLQAQCPFRAFAEVRLKAEPLAKPPRGLTKSERGEMVHEVLYLFWKAVKTQTNLKLFSMEVLQNTLKNNIQQVLDRWQKKFHTRLKPRYMQLEGDRLIELLTRFMVLESQRPPFEVVGLEVQKTMVLNSLAFSLRFDRVDRLASGEMLIIDYKTGQVKPHLWFKEPLEAPQLPLYYLATTQQEQPAIGIAFSVLQAQDIKYQGISNHFEGLPGVTSLELEAFSNLVKIWKVNLENLAQDFKEGVASVKPLHGPQTCRSCKLQGLCRIGVSN